MHFITLLIFLILSFSSNSYAAEKKVIKIGTGGLLEGHYNIGIKLCHYISESNNNIKCELVPTQGSLENLSLLQEGHIDFAFSLSNLALELYNGTGHFTKPFQDIYQVLRLHDEVFITLVRDDGKILVFDDLEGKNISNGTPSADSSFIYKDLEYYYAFRESPRDIELDPEDYAKALCNKNIDAIVLMTGAPNALTNLVSNLCETNFIAIGKKQLDLFIKNSPGFYKTILKEEKHPYVVGNQETISSPVIFVAGPSIDKSMVNNFMAYFKTKLFRFKVADPILSGLEDKHFTTKFVLPDVNGKVEKYN